MPDPLCKPCQARGRKVKATRLVPEAGSNIPKCDSCWFHRVPVELSDGEKSAASARPDPPLTERKSPMGRRPKADWQKVQADRAAGMAMSELIEKYVRSALRRLAAAHGLRWRLICRIDGETVYVGRVKK